MRLGQEIQALPRGRGVSDELSAPVSVPEPPRGWFEYGYAVLANGDLGLVRTERDIRGEYARYRSAVFRGVGDARWNSGNWRVRLSAFDGRTESAAIEVATGQWPLIDRLTDGRWVVVASRAEPEEKNARIFTADGVVADEFAVGDGVEHVRCAPDGTIWIGYLDEGVYASPNADGSAPLSASGLACCTPDGTVVWMCNGDARAGLFIDDCKALTLDGNALWCCPDVTYAIARIRNGTVETWKNDIGPVAALAVDDEHVVLAGGLGNESDRVALVRLCADRAEPLGELRLHLPLPNDTGLVQAHGAVVHVVDRGRWSRLSVAGVRSTLARS